MRAVLLLFLVWLGWLLTLPPRPPAVLVFVTGLPLLALASRTAFHGHAGNWRTFVRETADAHALALILLFAFGVQFADAHGVTTDGVIYFTQLRSLIFDRDLDVAAEFAFLQQPPRPSHVVPIGPTFVWLPLYAAVASVDGLGRAWGLWSAPSAEGVGLTLPYIRAALVSSFAIGALGLIVLHARLRGEFSRGVAFAATLLLFGATPLVWYMVYEPSMTHAASFGFVAMFVVAAARLTSVDMRAPACMGLGFLLGLAVMTRPQEALFALFPACLLLFGREAAGIKLRAAIRLAAWAFVGIAPLLALQAFHSAMLLSRESFALVGGGGYLDFFNAHWADTLWSSWHGFFSWTPVTYIAFLALFAYVRRDRGWAVAGIAIVLLMAWVNGSTTDWAAGWSFGGRRFTSVLAVLAPGIAYAIHGLMTRPSVSLAIVSLLAVAWSQLLLAQYQRGLLRDDQPASFAQVIRQQAALATEPPFVYPFAFPANVAFAWRTGLPIGEYDLLGAEPWRATFDLEMGAAADRFLRSGWSSPVVDPYGDLRWINGEAAEMLIPLDVARGGGLAVTWSARTRRLDPPEPATFALVINGRETFRFTPGTEQETYFTFTVPAGEAIFARGVNRLVFERRAGQAPVAIYGITIK